MKLMGKTAFVTGGGAGMGRAIVDELVAEGARVYTNDIRADRLAELREAAAYANGKVVAVEGDLARPDDIARMTADALDRFGHVDILVNNAGIFDYMESVTALSLETWNTVMAVNVTSHFLLAKALIPGMAARGSGTIVGIASAAGLTGGGGGPAYTAAKHAVIGLGRQLAVEWGPKGIRSNVICPGVVETPLLGQAAASGTIDGIKAFVGMTPARRMGQPVEIAKAVVFLASDDASFMHGSIVSVDGGFTAF
jgi:3-oxoacyl-[acyl-carrier protein] reductase